MNIFEGQGHEAGKFHRTPPGAGRTPPLSGNPPHDEAGATADSEFHEMVRRFEETVACFAPPESAHPPKHDKSPFDFPGIDTTLNATPTVQPLHSRDARPQPVLAPSRVEPRTTESAPTRVRAAAASFPTRARERPVAMVVAIVITLALGAGAGFTGAKRTGYTEARARIDSSVGGGIGIRLDRELRQEAVAAATP